MKISASLFSAAILTVAAVLFTAPATAHADTYQIVSLGSTPGFGNGVQRSLVGIEASGAVVIFDNHEQCGSQATECYETWVQGTLVSLSTTNPSSVYDNGTPCTPDAPAGVFASLGTCNNGREVYATSPSNNPFVPDQIFTGPDPVADFFSTGLLSNAALLNSSGDFAYELGGFKASQPGDFYEAIDLTTTATPEPASLFLLGTGLLAGLGSMRRRQQ